MCVSIWQSLLASGMAVVKLKYPSSRMNLISTLAVLSDIDYQWEIWVDADKSKLQEYDACLHVVERVKALLKQYGSRLKDEAYTTTSEWPAIMSAARLAVRVMHEEQNWLQKVCNTLTSLQRRF